MVEWRPKVRREILRYRSNEVTHPRHGERLAGKVFTILCLAWECFGRTAIQRLCGGGSLDSHGL